MNKTFNAAAFEPTGGKAVKLDGWKARRLIPSEEMKFKVSESSALQLTAGFETGKRS
jgi:hypothetical protein